MKFGFIGAGKVGTAFGRYLQKKGFYVKGYYSRSFESALKAAAKTNSIAYETPEGLAKDVDFLLITTPDDEIKGTCDRLADKESFREGQIVAHMSGTSSSHILQSAKKMGCFIYSIHPLQSFADVSRAVEDLENTYFSFEGDSERIDAIEALFKKTGNSAFRIATGHKALYHAAACIFSNYLVTLMNLGLMFFRKIGIPEEEGFQAVLPLVMGTIKNIEALGADRALTGPIARGDKKTVLEHIVNIEKEIPDALPFYIMMGKMTLSLASEYKLRDMQKIEALGKILSEVQE